MEEVEGIIEATYRGQYTRGAESWESRGWQIKLFNNVGILGYVPVMAMSLKRASLRRAAG